MGTQHHQEVGDFIREHGPFLSRLALALTSNPADADDLVHDTWLAAFKTPKTITSERGWLATVMRRRAGAQRQRNRFEPLGEEPNASAGMGSSAPDEILTRLEREQLLNAALAQLDEPYRVTIYLRYHEGLGPGTIASRLDVPLKTVKTRLYRGLEMLRRNLDRSMGLQGAEDPRAEWFGALVPLAATHRSSALLKIFVMKKLLVVAALLAAAVATWSLVRVDFRSVNGSGNFNTSESPEPSAGIALSNPTEMASADLLPPSAATRETIPIGGEPDLSSLTVRENSGNGSPESDLYVAVTALADSSPGAPRTPIIARTSDDGVASFQNLTPGSYRVVVNGAPYESWASVAIEEGEESSIVVSLTGRLAIRGRVRLPDGMPAIGAVIWAGGTGRKSPVLPLGRSDELGYYEVLCAERNVDIQASQVGYAPSPSQSVNRMKSDANGTRLADFKLGQRGSSISGRVIDAAGLSMAGVTVSAGTFSPHGLESHQQASRPMTVVTDEEGAFKLPTGFQDGLHKLVALAPRFAPTIREVAIAHAPVETTLVMGRGAMIQGAVVAVDGTPAVGAAVTIDQHEDFVRNDFPYVKIEAVTDDQGHYSLSHVPLAWLRVAAVSAEGRPLAEASERVEGLAEDEVRTVDLELDEGHLVAGTVVDETGLPIQGLRIVAAGDMLNGGNRRKVVSDEAGRFRITGLPVPDLFTRGPQAVLTLRAVIFDTTGLFTYGQVEGIKLGDTDVRIVADRPTTPDAFITGRVLNGGQNIANDVQLSVWREGVNRGTFVRIDSKTGGYRTGPLLPGRYELRVYTAGSLRDKTPWIEVSAAQTTAAPDLELVPLGSVELTFHWEDGVDRGSPASINQALICYLESLDGESASLRLERDGESLVASNVPPGRYRLRFSNQRSFVPLTGEVHVTPGDATETSVLVSNARHIVVAAALPFEQTWDKVTLSYGRPGSESMVDVESKERDEITNPPYAAFRVLISPGTWRFVIHAGDEIERSAEFSIPVEPTGKDEVYRLEE